MEITTMFIRLTPEAMIRAIRHGSGGAKIRCGCAGRRRFDRTRAPLRLEGMRIDLNPEVPG
jgi:hypothetical protein